MPKDYATTPRAQVRRSDRAVEDEGWMKELLQRAPMGEILIFVGGFYWLIVYTIQIVQKRRHRA